MPKYKIILTTRAIEEINSTISYYNNKQTGLGKRFYTHFKKRISAIKQHPFSCAIRYDDIRFAMLDKFPYAAHYNVEANTITIQGVLSTHQDPHSSWVERE